MNREQELKRIERLAVSLTALSPETYTVTSMGGDIFLNQARVETTEHACGIKEESSVKILQDRITIMEAYIGEAKQTLAMYDDETEEE